MNNFLGKLKPVTFLTIYLVIVLSFGIFSYILISELLKEEIGNKAMTLAIGVSNTMHFSDAEIGQLLDLDFNSLLKNETNKIFESKARNIMSVSDIKYIYLVGPLPKNRIKYRIEPDEEETYGEPAGTPLDSVYILDAVVDHKTRLADTDNQWYTDKDRYTTSNMFLQQVYRENKPGFKLNQDEWGTYITGYAPFYSEEGRFIGIIGVDLFLDNLNSSLQESFFIILCFVMVLLAIGLITYSFYCKFLNAVERADAESILSTTDSLTGLLNRRGFIQKYQPLWIRGQKNGSTLSLMLIDVDYFKEYNDNYGHLAGDDALKKIAEAIESIVHMNGGFAGRLGGDEFVAAMINITQEEACRICQNINQAVTGLAIPHDYSNTGKYQSVSIGLSQVVPSGDITDMEILRQADHALYYAKRQGRNRFELWNDDKKIF